MRRILHAAVIFVAALAFASINASRILSGEAFDVYWPMGGHEITNLRSQSHENQIDSSNADRLLQKWVLTTGGDVSATPAVAHGGVYFPDWGGNLWKVNAQTGEVVWQRSISEYNGIAGAIARSSPAYSGHRGGTISLISVALSGIRRSRHCATITPIRSRPC
jgi:polyvinyl alcohol dehydrogenase (cytochrome)